jgi:hypothetical protein
MRKANPGLWRSQAVFEFIIIVESTADFRTAKSIAERLITDRIPWLTEYLTNTFTWSGLETNTEFSSWRDIRTIREALKTQGIPSPRYLKGTGKSDGAAAHIVLQLITQLKRQRDIRAVLFVRDSDNQDERRVRLEQVREERGQNLSDTAIVIGVADTKREAWVLNGFVPLDESEERLLADLRQRLLFDPTIEAHRLRATTADEPERIRNAKIILDILTQENQEREILCWQITPLDVLRERGKQTGLTAYIVEVEERLIPILQ